MFIICSSCPSLCMPYRKISRACSAALHGVLSRGTGVMHSMIHNFLTLPILQLAVMNTKCKLEFLRLVFLCRRAARTGRTGPMFWRRL